MTKTLDYKLIHKWLKNGNIDTLYAAYRSYYPNVESMLQDVIEIDPELEPTVFDWCLKNGKHVGHFLEVSSAKQHMQKKQPFVLYGTAGTGKTTIAKQIALELGYHLIIIDASGKDMPAFPHSEKSITGEKLAVLFDEADRGTAKFYERVLELSKKKGDIVKWAIPVIFTVNFYNKFKLKVDAVYKIEINALPPDTIASILYAKAKDLNLPADMAERIDNIACECKGDVRQALNVLEHGNLIIDKDIEPMDVADVILTKQPKEAAELVSENYKSIGFVSMILSVNIHGDFAQNVMDYRVLATVDKLKYKINKDIISSLISVIDKHKKVKLSFPRSYKLKSDEK